MPRTNRPHRKVKSSAFSDRDLFDHDLIRWRRTETRRGSEWNVQAVPENRAIKPYTCPGCSGQITIGVAHLVSWRADGILGDDVDLSERRHWHTACWQKF